MKNYSLTAVTLFIILLIAVCMTSCSKGYGCYYSATHSIETRNDREYFQPTTDITVSICETGKNLTSN